MLVAVTGATGFVGRHAVAELVAAGRRIRAWHRPGTVPPTAAGVEWLPGRLGDTAAAAALVAGVDAVVHAALEPGQSLAAAAANVAGSLQLLDEARRAGVGRFVFISSAAVLDEPRDAYAAGKAAVELFAHAGGVPFVSLRPARVYGLDRPPERSLYAGVVAAVLRGEPVTSGRGGRVVHVGDVARAVRLAVESTAAAGRALALFDLDVSEAEVARLAAAAAGVDVGVTELPRVRKPAFDAGPARELGLAFGGRELLRATVGELAAALGRGADRRDAGP